MLQLVGKLVGPCGLSADNYYENKGAAREPTLSLPRETQVVAAAGWAIQLRLSLLNCLADRKPLKLVF